MPVSKMSFLILIAVISTPQMVLADDHILKLQIPFGFAGYKHFAFSPDGKVLAGGTGAGSFGDQPFGGEVILWRATTGKIDRTLDSHGADVNCLTFSRDGSRLASASTENGIVKIWDLATYDLLTTISLTEGTWLSPVETSLFLSADGGIFAAVMPHENGAEHLNGMISTDVVAWDTKTGKELWRLDNSDVKHATISHDGTVIAAFASKSIRQKSRSKSDPVRVEYVNPRIEYVSSASGKTLKTHSLEAGEFPDLLAFIPHDSIACVDGLGMTMRSVETGKVERGFPWDKSRPSYKEFSMSADRLAAARTGIVRESGHDALDARHSGEAIPRRGFIYFVEIVDASTGLATGFKLFDRPKEILSHAAFSPDLTRMACTLTSYQCPVILDLSKLELPQAVGTNKAARPAPARR